MSYYDIPFDTQIEIIKRLQIESLIRFRCVSKPWKFMIDSSEFNIEYSKTRPQRLLISYAEQEASEFKRSFVSIVDDDTDNFPQDKFDLDVPSSISKLKDFTVVGSSHGLVCLYGTCFISGTKKAIIWNPLIRKSVAIVVDLLYSSYKTDFGFGVCPQTLDPKIVKISHLTHFCRLVKVFSLSLGIWGSPIKNHLHNSITFTFELSQVVIDEFIYWVACDRIFRDDDGNRLAKNLIISFDMTNDVFMEIQLPYRLALDLNKNLRVSKVRECLVVLDYIYEVEEEGYDLWMMMMTEHCVPKFTKLYTIKDPNASVLAVVGFRKSGSPIVEIQDDDSVLSTLAIYEPTSERFNRINGIWGIMHSLVLHSYMETLLLLDHSD